VLDPGFQKVGHTTLNRSMLNRTKFLLNETLYPLDGQLVLTMKCFAEEADDSLDYKGFLSLYQLVSDMGSWTRFWCVLAEGRMRFWRYPEDETRKAACVVLALEKCLSRVVAVPASVASFPNSMQVDVGIAEGDNATEEIRMLFAADTPESKEVWMNAINVAIRNSNVWNFLSNAK